MLAQNPLYRSARPASVVGIILVKGFRIPSDSMVDSLDGYLEDGSRLLQSSLLEEAYPKHEFGRKGSSIWFVRGRPPAADETISLLRAKRDELEDKVSQFAGFWRASVGDVARRRADVDRLEERLSDEETPELSSRADLSGRLSALVERSFPRLDFCRDSLDVLAGYCAANDMTWRLLEELNDSGHAGRSGCECFRFEGAGKWWEAKPARLTRVYFRPANSKNDRRTFVLVSLKRDQAGRDTRFLKDHNQD